MSGSEPVPGGRRRRVRLECFLLMLYLKAIFKFICQETLICTMEGEIESNGTACRNKKSTYNNLNMEVLLSQR